MLRALPFSISGPGTYSLNWNSAGNAKGMAIPPATYLCRVQLDGNLWCKGFITR